MKQQLKLHRRNRNLMLAVAWILIVMSLFSFATLWVFVTGIVLVNGYAWFLMARDKALAKRNTFRIPEASLLLVAACGGAAGALLGMFIHRHKTKHLRFLILIPLFLAVQLVLLYVWLY
jgi:uncharacterized membrane protein YsdA (DUF1294 family)